MSTKKPLRFIPAEPTPEPSTWKVEVRSDPKSKWVLHKSGLATHEEALKSVPPSYVQANNYRISEVNPLGPAVELPPPSSPRTRR